MVGYVQVTNLNKADILGRYFYQRPYIEKRVRSLIEMPADLDKSTRPLVIYECELTRTSEISKWY